MNLIVLFKEDFISDGQVRLTGRRREHLTSVLHSKPGDRFNVGLLNGLMGHGIVVEVGEAIVLDVVLSDPPPKFLPLTLIVALPRPHLFKRTLFFAASLGIKKIIVLNFSRVEKSLWNSSVLKPDAIKEQLILGLEQGKDTRIPEVILKNDFKSFVQNELTHLMTGTRALVAHPSAQAGLPSVPKGPITLVIGPEGGILPWELDLLSAIGFQAMDLGPRILRVDTVLPYVIGKLFDVAF